MINECQMKIEPSKVILQVKKADGSFVEVEGIIDGMLEIMSGEFRGRIKETHILDMDPNKKKILEAVEILNKVAKET